jgi:hypothetical protein
MPSLDVGNDDVAIFARNTDCCNTLTARGRQKRKE